MSMKEIFVKDILEICNAELICGDKEAKCGNFNIDTRKINSEDVFVGIKGEHNDGNLLYKEAIEKGAKCVIIQDIDITDEYKEKCNVSIIKVENTILALQKIAKYKRDLYNIPVVAITGSVGKTSTKDLVASVLSKKYKVLKTQGNYNNEIGLPLTILSLKDEEAMVLEMGMNQFGEISVLTNIARPDVAIITNIGTAHIGNLGSRENILKAKLEILEGLNKEGILVINNDNDLLNEWNNKNNNIKTITYGMENKSDFFAYNIELKENGSTYTVKVDNKEYEVKIKVGGKHFVSNGLCAIAVGRIFDIKIEDILDGIYNFELTKKRMEIKTSKNGATIINDCYNANYDSMKAAIEYLGKVNKKRKIAVLGDMLELGEYTEELHRKVGKEVYLNNIDILACVGNFSKYIAKEAIKNGMDEKKVFLFKENEEAIEFLKEMENSEVAILIKASNSLNFSQITDAIC